MTVRDEGFYKDPKFWINTYWNEWFPRGRVIRRYRGNGDVEWLKNHPVLTFSEYVSNIFSEEEYDSNMIPKRFVHQADRLARAYNELLCCEELDLDKMNRLVVLAQKIIYDGCTNVPI